MAYLFSALGHELYATGDGRYCGPRAVMMGLEGCLACFWKSKVIVLNINSRKRASCRTGAPIA
jgi:hypothetical protein